MRIYAVMKIVTIVGARPQFIKAAAVSRVLKVTEQVDEILVHTGQHYDDNMSEIFFRELEITKPHYTLGIGSGTHAYQTGEILKGIENILLAEKPELVMVYGDTNSTLAGALAAAKLNIPVAHVEAGLRSFNKTMPEEINRIVTDHLSSVLFAPTDTAVENLLHEGIAKEKIHLVGDVMYDAALYYGHKAEEQSNILRDLQLNSKQYVLTTIHRASNTDKAINLKAIVDGLLFLSKVIKVVFPLHPRTKSSLEKNNLIEQVNKNLLVIPPVGYLDMIMLEKHAKTIVTDSGGVQKEAYFYKVPCVTLRDETEWVELIDTRWNVLVSIGASGNIFNEIILKTVDQAKAGKNVALYGSGKAAFDILQIISGTDYAFCKTN
jgi:UDP-GlcNAc3NAcA epimerase